MTYDEHIFDHPANHEPDPIGQQDGETCGRYPAQDEDQPRGYKPQPCGGEMIYRQESAEDYCTNWTECDTCGEIGD